MSEVEKPKIVELSDILLGNIEADSLVELSKVEITE